MRHHLRVTTHPLGFLCLSRRALGCPPTPAPSSDHLRSTPVFTIPYGTHAGAQHQGVHTTTTDTALGGSLVQWTRTPSSSCQA